MACFQDFGIINCAAVHVGMHVLLWHDDLKHHNYQHILIVPINGFHWNAEIVHRTNAAASVLPCGLSPESPSTAALSFRVRN